MSVDVILPCLDEALALPWMLGRLPSGYRPIVVDNGSKDGTADVARSLGALVVGAAVPGYGAAVHAGLEATTAEIVAIMDCDASLDPAELPPLVALVLAGHADLVVGRRRALPGAWPWHARVGNAVLAHRLRRRVGLDIHDIGPVRVARRDPLLELGVQDRRFGYTVETLVRAGRAGWRVVEMDVAYGQRATGSRSKVTGSALGTARTVRDLVRVLP